MASGTVAKSYATEMARISEEVLSSTSDKLTAYRNGFLATFTTGQTDSFGTYITRLVYYNLYVQEVINKIKNLPSGAGSVSAQNTQQVLAASQAASKAAAQLAENSAATTDQLRAQITSLNRNIQGLEQTITNYNAFFNESMKHVSQIVNMYPQATAPPSAADGGQ